MGDGIDTINLATVGKGCIEPEAAGNLRGWRGAVATGHRIRLEELELPVHAQRPCARDGARSAAHGGFATSTRAGA
jgi:hypothetical protein